MLRTKVTNDGLKLSIKSQHVFPQLNSKVN